MVQALPDAFRSAVSTRQVFNYHAFGLTIASEIECDGLPLSTDASDVRVRVGPLAVSPLNSATGGLFFCVCPGHLLLKVRGLARYLVSAGREINVEPAPSADPGLLRLVLFGPAFGALLYQRGCLVLHGSAIITDRGAVVFTGPSAYGKSTIAAAFFQRGYRILADDLCAIDPTDTPKVVPSLPSLKVWPDAANRLELNRDSLRPIRGGIEKYSVDLGSAFLDRPVPLAAIYLLDIYNENTVGLDPVRGIAKIKTLNRAAYRPDFVDGMDLGVEYSRQIAQIARRTKVALVRRPHRGFRIQELADRIEADFSE